MNTCLDQMRCISAPKFLAQAGGESCHRCPLTIMSFLTEFTPFPPSAISTALSADREFNRMGPDIAPVAILDSPRFRRRNAHWTSNCPDASVARPFAALGSSTWTARPTARLHRRFADAPILVDARNQHRPQGVRREAPGRLGCRCQGRRRGQASTTDRIARLRQVRRALARAGLPGRCLDQCHVHHGRHRGPQRRIRCQAA